MPGPRDRYETILREHGCSRRVIAHCDAVADCALSIAGNSPLIDRNLLVTGAMLHDIGRGSTHGLGHAQAGAALCRMLGYPEPVARIVECHTGAGITADEYSLLRLQPRDCIPKTAEERLVTHADNLIAGSRRVTIHETLASAYHLNRRIRRRIYRLALDIEILCGP
jgi:uncharacterized protein